MRHILSRKGYMTLHVELIPVLNDNYIFIIIDPGTNNAAVVDPATSDDVIQYLAKKQLNLSAILLTHHHRDHTEGVQDLRSKFPEARVFGYSHDCHRLPKLTDELRDNSTIKILDTDFTVWNMPGHTSGHIVYVSTQHNIAFTGDVLFGMGCGRLFEGTYQEMFQSLQRLKTLPPNTKIYCAHEYTQKL